MKANYYLVVHGQTPAYPKSQETFVIERYVTYIQNLYVLKTSYSIIFKDILHLDIGIIPIN